MNSLYMLNLYLKLISLISHVEINLNFDLPICLVRFAKYCYISGQLVVPNFRLSQQ